MTDTVRHNTYLMEDETPTTIPKVCANCSSTKVGASATDGEHLKRCTGCKSVFYCCRNCQADHWGQHKKQCKFWINLDTGRTYVGDDQAHQMAAIQEKTFLSSSSGNPPAIGQRVELHCCIKKSGRQFCMSGQIVKVLENPNKMLRPLYHIDDKTHDTDMSVKLFQCLFLHSEIRREFVQMQKQVSDSVTATDGAGFSGENLVCPCGQKDCTLGNISMAAWNQSSQDFKQRCLDAIVKKHGCLHGQKVLVQARLAFDDDQRRSSAEGPWKDGILVDGRDIWELTLEANDHMMNQWQPELTSFRNLGPDAQPRCWPWSLEKTLPYEYKYCCGTCEVTGPIVRNLCLGPFGCASAGHSHHSRHGFDDYGAPLPSDRAGAA